MENIKPNEQRAKIAMLLIWLVLVFEVLSLYSGYLQYQLLEGVAAGGAISDEVANANDSREQIISGIYLVLYFTSAVTFILWFRRAYYNLHLKSNTLSYSDGWAAGAWFVPFVCLYKPYRIMKEMYAETRFLLMESGENVSEKLSLSLLPGWWALWLFSNFLGQFVFRYTMNADTLDGYINSTIASMVGNIIGIPLALLAVKVIKDYADVEHLLYEVPNAAEDFAPAAPDSGYPEAGLSMS